MKANDSQCLNLVSFSASNLEYICTDSPGQDASPSQVPSQQCWYSFAAELTEANWLPAKWNCLSFKSEPRPVWGSNPWPQSPESNTLTTRPRPLPATVWARNLIEMANMGIEQWEAARCCLQISVSTQRSQRTSAGKQDLHTRRPYCQKSCAGPACKNFEEGG